MKFKSGFLGVLIVALALMGTIITGHVADVGEHTETVETYEQITDVSGLFNYSAEREYIAFNPAANYTGYTDGTYNYTPSETANNYSIVAIPGTINTVTADLSSAQAVASGSATANLWNGNKVNVATILAAASVDPATVDGCRINLYDYTDWTPLYSGVQLIGGYNPSALEIASNYQNNVNLNQYYSVELSDGTQLNGNDIKYFGGANLKKVWAHDYAYNYDYGAWGYYDIDGITAYIEVGKDLTAIVYEETHYTDGLVVKKAVNSGNISTMYIVMSDTLVFWRDLPSDHWVSPIYGINNYWCSEWETNYTPAVPTITTTTDTTYNYLDVRDGISLNGNNTTWANGEPNGQIDIIIKSPGVYSQTYIYPNWGTSQTDKAVIVATDAFGAFMVATVNSIYDVAAYQNIGAWPAIKLSIHADGSVMVSPIVSIVNMQSYNMAGVDIPISPMAAPGGDIVALDYLLLGTSPTFSVSDTRVFLNTYGAVMIDPSINIRDYFPSGTYPTIRLNLYSFAIVGDSITINGTVCPITDGRITVSYHTGTYDENGAEVIGTREYLLNSLYVTFDVDGHAYVMVNNDTSLDMGTISDTNVSMVGIWYFTTAASKGVSVDRQVYDWNVGTFGIDSVQFMVICAGLVIVGLLIARRVAKVTVIDYVVVGVSLFIILGMVA